MENNLIELNESIKKMNKLFFESKKNGFSSIIRIVPYLRKGKQLIIIVTETDGNCYSAYVQHGEKKFDKEYTTNNINAYLRYILENDKTFFNELIQQAKDDIENGVFDTFLQE